VKAASSAPLAQVGVRLDAPKSIQIPYALFLLYATQKPTRALAPKERKCLQECAQARVQARRGCIRKDAPAGAGGQTNTRPAPFLCTQPRGQWRARGGESRPLARSARSSVPMPKARRAGAPGVDEETGKHAIAIIKNIWYTFVGKCKKDVKICTIDISLIFNIPTEAIST